MLFARTATQHPDHPQGFASGAGAPEPHGLGNHLSWKTRLQKHGAVCVACPSKKSSGDRKKCLAT
jgi:hypothetical protein